MFKEILSKELEAKFISVISKIDTSPNIFTLDGFDSKRIYFKTPKKPRFPEPTSVLEKYIILAIKNTSRWTKPADLADFTDKRAKETRNFLYEMAINDVLSQLYLIDKKKKSWRRCSVSKLARQAYGQKMSKILDIFMKYCEETSPKDPKVIKLYANWFEQALENKNG